MKQKYLWYTDTHLSMVPPWTKYFFLRSLNNDAPEGIFLTGDISNGKLLELDLTLIANFAKCPVYFVLGNHDYQFSSFDKSHDTVRRLCNKYPNLHWLTQEAPIQLNEEVCVIGTEGWYDASIGKPEYLKYSFDWMLIKDFRDLPNINARLEAFKEKATQSANIIKYKIEEALDMGYKNIYVLTHFPPWQEATRDKGLLLEPYWLPYNTNLRFGKAIEDIMIDKNKRHITVLAGHTHTDCWIHVSRNIECKVNKAKYYGMPRNEEHIFI